MKKNGIETLVGALVLVVAVSFLFFAYKTAGIRMEGSGYIIKAKFERIDGLHLGSDVRVGGIKVGTVVKQGLDPKSYLAELQFQIDDNVKLPKDSSAQIVSDGLLGNKYVSLVPGADEAMLKTGETIEFTQSAVNIETLIGKFMFSGNDKHEEQKSGAEGNAAVPSLSAPANAVPAGNAAPETAPAENKVPAPEPQKQ